MGRLDDIANRNRKAMAGDHGLAKLVGKLDRDGAPSEPDIPGMRRSTRTHPLIVIAFMALLGGVVAFMTCRNRAPSEDELLELERQRALDEVERSKTMP